MTMTDPTPRPLPRVLIIEDQPEVALAAQALLLMHGYQVRCAYDGAEGLALAAQFDPHFVLLDTGLPRLTGLEVARHLRLNNEGARRFIVAIAALADGAGDHAAFDASVARPVVVEQLLWLLHKAWREHFEGTLHCY